MDSRQRTIDELDATYGKEGANDRMTALLKATNGLSLADVAVALSSAYLATAEGSKCMAVGPDGKVISSEDLAKSPQFVEICKTLMWLVIVSEGAARVQDIDSDDAPDEVKRRRAIIKEVESLGK